MSYSAELQFPIAPQANRIESSPPRLTSCSDAGYSSSGTPSITNSPSEFSFDPADFSHPNLTLDEMDLDAFDACRVKQEPDLYALHNSNPRRRSVATCSTAKHGLSGNPISGYNSTITTLQRPNSANCLTVPQENYVRNFESSPLQQHVPMQSSSSSCCFSNVVSTFDVPSPQLCNNSTTASIVHEPLYEKFPNTQNFFSGQDTLKPELARRQHSDSVIFGQEHFQQNSTQSTNTQNHSFSSSLNAVDLRSRAEDFGFMDPSMLTIQSSPGQDRKHKTRSACSVQPNYNKLTTTPNLTQQGTSCDFVPFVPPQTNLKSCQFSTPRSSDVGILTVLPHHGGVPGTRDVQRDSPSGNPRYTSEDEAWRSYLENPLTAATTAMMSIHGDEDSAAALGILYDYYKVPREKRILTYQPNTSNRDKQTRCVSSQEGNISSTGLTSEDVSAMTPVISAASTAVHGDNSLEIAVRDHSTEEVISPRDLNNFSHPDVITLSTVRPELSALCEVNGLGEYLNIGRVQEDIRQLTPDSAYSEAKDSPPQMSQIYTDYTNKYINQQSRTTRYTSGNSPKLYNKNNNNNLLTTTPTGNQPFNSPSSSLIPLPNIFSPTLEILPSDYTGEYFEYAMEAPKSLKQKDGEPTMSYINKGQFYCISLRECAGRPWRYKNTRVTSVVQIVFGDGKPEDEQLRHWKYWHARQHTAKQRIIDIADYKESCMISDIDEFAHNAISFNWDVNDVAKIFVSCNCLSTDFSAQKGIKGLPLLLQIDTYMDNRRGAAPAHRGMCQLKVFCDKGAERKIRDEERKAMRKRQRSGIKVNNTLPHCQTMAVNNRDPKTPLRSPSITPPPSSAVPTGGAPGKRQEVVYFKTVVDSITPSVYFVPEIFGHVNNARGLSSVSPCPKSSDIPSTSNDADYTTGQLDFSDPLRGATKRSLSMLSSDEGEFPSNKVLKRSEDTRVLLYVRRETDDVYDGIMLCDPTLDGLKRALEEKYGIPVQKMSKVLKKSRKGILVNVDDNIVRHYSNEDTFIIAVETETIDNDVSHKITLSVV
ncbi:grainyhead-like protein 2 homolog isoform X1 [Ciona intestinalis]